MTERLRHISLSNYNGTTFVNVQCDSGGAAGQFEKGSTVEAVAHELRELADRLERRVWRKDEASAQKT